MSSNSFVSSVLLIVCSLMVTFYHFKAHFTGSDYFESRAYSLKERVESEKLQSELVRYQLEELRQHVAVVLPNLDFRELSFEQQYPYRNLASLTVASENQSFRKKKVEMIFARGQEAFQRKDFQYSNQSFREIITDYPTSIHVIRSHFLLVEGLFHLKQFEKMTDLTGHMVTLFPEDELTGHALLRLAAVFEYEDRSDDATDILNAVIKTYKNDSQLRDLAWKKKRALR